MALGILGAYGGLNKKEVPDCLFVGELSLDGGIRGVRGALPIAIEARGKKISRLVVPELNAREAAMVGGVDVYPVRSLLDVIRFVNTGNGIVPLKVDSDTLLTEAQHYAVDFKDVRGQQTAKRALEVARFFPLLPPRSASFRPQRRRSLSAPNGPRMWCAPCTSKVRRYGSPSLLMWFTNRCAIASKGQCRRRHKTKNAL